MRGFLFLSFGCFYVPGLFLMLIAWWFSGGRNGSPGFSIGRPAKFLTILFAASAIILVGLEAIFDYGNFKDGNEACQAGHYQEGVNFFDEVISSQRIIDIFGYSARSNERKTECLTEFASVSVQNEKFDLALSAYIDLVGMGEVEPIRSQVATLFVEQTPDSLVSIRTCDQVDQLIDHELIPEEESTVPALYLACGRLYINRDEPMYEKAIDIYGKLVNQYPDVTETQTALNHLEIIYPQMARNTGTLGNLIIQENWDLACKGEPATSLAISMFESESNIWFGGGKPTGLLLIAGLSSSDTNRKTEKFEEEELHVPESLLAKRPGDFRYAVCWSELLDPVETCNYLNTDRKAVRWVHEVTVTIREVTTGEIFQEEKFRGGTPDQCPEEISTGDENLSLVGGRPSIEDINNWLAIATDEASQVEMPSQNFMEMTIQSTREAISFHPTTAGKIVFEDSFDNNFFKWQGNENSTAFNASRDFQDSTLTWNIQANQSDLATLYNESFPSLDDFSIVVDIEQTNGPSNVGHGFYFNVSQDGESGYVFIIRGEGNFAIFHFEGQEWTPVTDWKENEIIQSSSKNQLGITAIGTDFAFYINDMLVEKLSLQKPDFVNYGIVVFIDANTQQSFVIDNLIIRTPQP